MDDAAPVTVMAGLGDDGRRRATEALVNGGAELLAIVAPDGHPDVDRLAEQLRADPTVAMAVAAQDRPRPAGRSPATAVGGVRLIPQLVARLRNTEPTVQPTMVLRVRSVLAVGGFDPAFPGLGLADLAHRLRAAGFKVTGLPGTGPPETVRPENRSTGTGSSGNRSSGTGSSGNRSSGTGATGTGAGRDPSFQPVLDGGLDVVERCRAEGLWLVRHGSAGQYRRALLAAARIVGRRAGSGAVGPTGEELTTIVEDAKRWWAGPAPHEDQAGIGYRADWRFLLPRGDRRTTAVFLAADDRRAAPAAWRWLVDDGWTERVTVSVAGSPPITHPPVGPADSDQSAATGPVDEGSAATGPVDVGPVDVVFVGLGAELAPAMAAVGPDGALVAEQDRSPMEGGRRLNQLQADRRFTSVQRFLVTPNLADAKRYVPLADGRGLSWLLAPPPALLDDDAGTGGAVGPAGGMNEAVVDGIANRIRAVAGRLAVSAAAGALNGPAATREITSRAATLAGQGLLIAAAGRSAQAAVADDDPTVVLTSGHDEGSRVIVATLTDGRSEPTTVTKVSSRPRYNGNVDAEVARINELRRRMSNPAASRGDALPRVEEPIDIGPLRASVESYAGRWTASDLCNRVPHHRERVLDQVLDTIDRFTMATADPVETWNRQTFDRYLGELFDRYEELVGVDPSLRFLRNRLQQRADLLSGTMLPLAQRHYDLGPWNVVFGDGEQPITLIDWELGPPRIADRPGPAGADQLYFTKYWLHLAMRTRSVDDELTAFEFLANRQPNHPAHPADEPRTVAARTLARSLDRVGVPQATMPLLTTHVWLEAGLYTIERRRANGIEPGSPGRYLSTLARHAVPMLDFWAPD